jgi:hypothetical protein
MAGVEDQGLETYVPLYVRGTVVKGFGRGNKELGIPTGKRYGLALSIAICRSVPTVECRIQWHSPWSSMLRVVIKWDSISVSVSLAKIDSHLE